MARRVRFAEDSQVDALAQTSKARRESLQIVDQIVAAVYSSKGVDVRDPEDNIQNNRHADYLANALLAQQRAQDAMMIARAMQNDVRHQNLNLQRNTSKYSNTKTVAETGERFMNTNEDVFIDRFSAQQIPLKDADLISISMSWLADVFNVHQLHA